MIWRALQIVGSRRVADILLVALATWFLLLLAWTQSSPLVIVQRIGTMWTFQALYLVLILNLIACSVVELPRVLRRARRREPSRGRLPAHGYEIVEPPWKDIEEAHRRLERSLYAVDRRGNRLVAERGRFAPLYGMVFHLLLPLLLPTAVWAVSTRRVVQLEAGEGEVLVPQPQGPRATIAIESIDVEYLGSEIFFTKLEAKVSVDGEARGRIRINESISVDGGDLRLSSMGYMPGLTVVDPRGRMLDRVYVKLGLFPPGTPAELHFPGMPHRLRLRFYPDAELDEEGEPQNATLNLRRPILVIDAERGKIPVGSSVLAPGEVANVEGYRVQFGQAGLWVTLAWVHDPGSKVAIFIFALSAFFVGLRILWPRTTWMVAVQDDQLVVTRRIEAFSAFAGEDEARRQPTAREEAPS